MGARRGAYRVFVEKPEGKRPAGRPRRRWEDNTTMDLNKFCSSNFVFVLKVPEKECFGHMWKELRASVLITYAEQLNKLLKEEKKVKQTT
jgi:hypothetical protein